MSEAKVDKNLKTDSETADAKKPQKEYKLEEMFTMLEERIKQLESPELSLEDSFRLYKEGIELLQQCNESIDKVEKKVLKLNGDMKTDEF